MTPSNPDMLVEISKLYYIQMICQFTGDAVATTAQRTRAGIHQCMTLKAVPVLSLFRHGRCIINSSYSRRLA